MIASVSGTVLLTKQDHVVIEVGGIGLQVSTTPATGVELRSGSHAMLSTTLVVREDSLTLYGFLSATDRDAFQILQSVSGIGPRIAMAALATYSADELRSIVARKDEASLTKISGIGKKGAQRLILELADKLGPPTDASAGYRANAQPSVGGGWQGQVREALIGLGWSAREAEEAVAVAEVEQNIGTPTDGASVTEPTVADMLARVLRGMSRR